MASHPPAECCTVGVKHDGQASGEMGKIAGYDAYIAYPKDKSTTNAVIYLTDVYGPTFLNHQLIADQYAANGYFCVIPDLFGGDPVPLEKPAGYDMQPWLKKHNTERVDPIVQKTIEELRGKFGTKNIGAVGYCYGAKYVIRFLRKGQIDAGYGAHPSFVTNEELAAIKGPLSIAAAETDSIFTTEKRHESEGILQKTGNPYQIFLYSGVQHGFGVRGDLSKKEVKLAKEQAFLQAVHWFDAWVKA